MRLHNTRTKQLDDVKPLNGSRLRIYSCGPTVYDHIHIGNLSSFIVADTVRRTAMASCGAVEHVMNFTDVDDKTIHASHEAYPDTEPMIALLKLTSDYADGFLSDMHDVGNDTDAMRFIKATDSIPDMQQLISQLVGHGFAYVADDGIYFSIAAYRQTGKTYGQLTDISASSTSEARIQNDEYDKASIHDFALWKIHKTGEPSWEFAIGDRQLDGRPGWHIECSAMSQRMLGQPFDIHTGGVDLMFPHHENEIAQSTALQTDPIYAQIFTHNEHLLVDGQKMSKSLQNFYTLETLRAKGFDPLAFRLLVLQSHYRKQAHFSWENLQAAQNRLRELQAMAVLRWQARPVLRDAPTFALRDVPLEVQHYLEDDLDTPQALAYLSGVTTQLLVVLIGEDRLDHFFAMLQGLDELLGLSLSELPDISEAQKQLIQERETARQQKAWARSDELRDSLVKQGILLRDTDSGPIWSYA